MTNKLISMTDFIQLLEDNMSLKKSTNALWLQSKDFMSLSKSYKNFLKQKLELWMFVPCGEEGNVLEEPNIRDYQDDDCQTDFNSYETDLNRFQQAKERLLFEGFEAEDEHPEYTSIKQNGTRSFSVIEGKIENYENQDVESMVKFNLTLTKSALKQTS